MKKLLAGVLMMFACAIPATANAAKFVYSVSFDQVFPGGAPTGDSYSAKGVFDADATSIVDTFFGPITFYDITAASGTLFSSFNPNLGGVSDVVGNTLDTPSFALLGNGLVIGADFRLISDAWGAYGVSSFIFVGGAGNYGEAFGPITELSITPFSGGVPEPATWAMMIAGFGLIGGAMRRRTTAQAATA